MKFFKFALPLLALLSAASASAKTIVYDVKDFHVSSAEAAYQNIEFEYPPNIANAVLTLNREAIEPPYLDSLVINFPDLEKLVVRNFRKLPDGKFRANVANAWIYKEVIVEVEGADWHNGWEIDINVFVSEKGTFINRDVENKGLKILQASGTLRDQTPTRVADIEKTVLEGKSISLSLRDRIVPIAARDDRAGFLVNTSWLGHGTKNIVVGEGSVSAWNVDIIEGIAIIVENGSEGPSVKVKYRKKGDQDYYYTQSQRLRDLLETSYEGI